MTFMISRTVIFIRLFMPSRWIHLWFHDFGMYSIIPDGTPPGFILVTKPENIEEFMSGCFKFGKKICSHKLPLWRPYVFEL